MKKKNRPSQFLKFGKFDLTFDSITPGEYIANMQDEKRLRYRRIELQQLQNNSHEDADEFAYSSTFILETSTRMGSIYAIGTITHDAIGDTHVYGHIDIGYDYLAFNLIFLGPILLAGLSETPLKLLICWPLVDFIIFIDAYMSAVYMKDMLLEHLQEPRHLLRLPVESCAVNPYLNI